MLYKDTFQRQKYIIANHHIVEMKVCSITAIYIFEIIALKYYFKMPVKLSFVVSES